MDDLLRFLHARNEADNHAYAYVAHCFGGEALLDSHLPMLDLVDMLARDYEAMDPSDSRSAGLRYAVRVLAQSYAEHPDYREEWRPWTPEPAEGPCASQDQRQSPFVRTQLWSSGRTPTPVAVFAVAAGTEGPVRGGVGGSGGGGAQADGAGGGEE